jgi:hypothetical protein
VFLTRCVIICQGNCCRLGTSSSLALTTALFFSTLALAAPKLDTLGPCTDAGVPDAVKKVLAPQGYRVVLDDGSTVALWPRAQIATASKAREDATYTLTPSTFVGVIVFDKNTRDYRGDAVPAGTYQLRYELQPSDGDHLGTSPTPDFLLLVPPGADPDPDRSYSFEQLVDLSRQVTGAKHPAPLNLLPADSKDLPLVTKDSEDHTILSFKLKTQSSDLPLSLVIKGTTTE